MRCQTTPTLEKHLPGGHLPQVIEDPIGYTEPAMDEEMSFPNPVVRTDLPTRRRRWPRILLGASLLGILTIVFLPQILSSKVGRKFVVSYISSKTNSPVTLESFKTSWFGPTTVRFLSINDPMNHSIGFKTLTCKASLLNLLRGKYKLGDTTIEGLHIDYMVDDGRGVSTLDLLKGPPGEGGGLISNLTGKITIKNGTVTLIRGTVQPKYFNTTWQQAKIENIEATFDVQSLDKPWDYTISADTIDDNDARGSFKSEGTVDAGGLDLDLTFTGENVRTGPIGAALIAGATPDDIRRSLGAFLGKVDIAIKTDNGRMTFERCEISGGAASFHLKPIIDLSVSPPALELDGQGGTISVGVSNRLASQVLVYLNPFFREAAGGSGNVELSLDKLHLPLTKQWAKSTTAQGRIKATSLTLNRTDEMSSDETLPKNLASQLALLTGDSDKTVPLDVEGPFSITDGLFTTQVMSTKVRDTSMMLDGTIDLDDGTIKMIATLNSAPSITSHFQTDPAAHVGIPIGGTIRQPLLDVLNLKGELSNASVTSLNDEINRQITRMRAKESQRLMLKSQNQVEEILRPLRGPSTQPTGDGKK
jgi:hypothetical protein